MARGGRFVRITTLIALLVVMGTAKVWNQTRQTLTIRGHEYSLYLYGSPAGEPLIVSSGDGGWIHLAPDVAAFLAGRGYFVAGFDARAYLSSFTTGQSTLRTEDEPHDYSVLVQYVLRLTGKKPILIGVSEGAGLSVLAATDPEVKSQISGVIALGLPDINELGWRWKDAMIYLTHKTPSEPTFSTSAVINRVAPLPLAAIHATHDEFVPLQEIRRVIGNAAEPKLLCVIESSNHRFSDNRDELQRQLLNSIGWVKQHASH